MTQAERDQMLIETHTLTKQTHEAVFGNGRPGIKAEVERVKGGLAVIKGLMVALSIVTAAIGAWAAF